MKNEISPLQQAVAAAGGQLALARRLGLKQGHIWWWLHRSRKIPADRVLEVEAATGISRYQLRPDVFGSVPDRTPSAREEASP